MAHGGSEPLRVSKRFFKAAEWAAARHAERAHDALPAMPSLGQVLGVASLVLEDGGTEHEAMAAMLLDATGDREVPLADLRDRFGKKVARLVAQCADARADAGRGDRRLDAETWRARREHALELFEHDDDPTVLRVRAADVLRELRTVVAELRRHGSIAFARFPAPPAEQLDSYRLLVDAIAQRMPRSNLDHELPDRARRPRAARRARDRHRRVAGRAHRRGIAGAHDGYGRSVPNKRLDSVRASASTVLRDFADAGRRGGRRVRELARSTRTAIPPHALPEIAGSIGRLSKVRTPRDAVASFETETERLLTVVTPLFVAHPLPVTSTVAAKSIVATAGGLAAAGEEAEELVALVSSGTAVPHTLPIMIATNMLALAVEVYVAASLRVNDLRAVGIEPDPHDVARDVIFAMSGTAGGKAGATGIVTRQMVKTIVARVLFALGRRVHPVRGHRVLGVGLAAHGRRRPCAPPAGGSHHRPARAPRDRVTRQIRRPVPSQ